MTIETFTLVKANGKRETTITKTDDHGNTTVQKFRRMELGPLGHLRINSNGSIEYVRGRSNHDPAITLRHSRIIATAMMTFVVALLVPSWALAQTHPSAEMLKGFHVDVYSAAQKADDVASKADKRYKEDVNKMKLAEADLRRAIAEENNAAKFAEIHSGYILASMVVATSGIDVISANADVASAYRDHIGERGSNSEIFTRWMKAIMAHEATFGTMDADKKLLDEAKAKFKKLSEK